MKIKSRNLNAKEKTENHKKTYLEWRKKKKLFETWSVSLVFGYNDSTKVNTRVLEDFKTKGPTSPIEVSSLEPNFKLEYNT